MVINVTAQVSLPMDSPVISG